MLLWGAVIKMRTIFAMHENKRQEEKKVIFGYKTTTNVSERAKEIKIIRSIVSEARK